MSEYDLPDENTPPEPNLAVPDSLPALVELRPNERPVSGRHFVTWGSVLLNDIRERPVKRQAVSEDEYALKMRRNTERLVASGVKDPDPNLDDKYPRKRADRAEQYARWRYKGFVCGEVASL